MGKSLSSREVVKIFIASPGDVKAEREAFRNVVEELNKTFSKRLSLHVEILGWEDTMPGQGRPQALINEDVKLCDLFIGLLYKRWGSPTGEYSSGFEEEFLLAQKLLANGSIKNIWLAFKTVEPELLQDPGEHLKKVIEFKKERIDKRDVLFKEISSIDDWKTQVTSWLLDYVMGLADSNAPVESDEISSFKQRNTLASIISNDSKKGREGIDRNFASIAEKMAGLSKLEDYSDVWQTFNNLDVKQLLHLRISSQFFSNMHFSSEHLGVHAINYVYTSFSHSELEVYEKSLIFESALQFDNQNLVAFWKFCFNDLERFIFTTIVGKADSDIKVKAINMKAKLGFKIPDEELEMIASDKALYEAAIRYIISRQDENFNALIIEGQWKFKMPERFIEAADTARIVASGGEKQFDNINKSHFRIIVDLFLNYDIKFHYNLLLYIIRHSSISVNERSNVVMRLPKSSLDARILPILSTLNDSTKEKVISCIDISFLNRDIINDSLLKNGGLQFLMFDSDYGFSIAEKVKSLYKDIEINDDDTAFLILVKMLNENSEPDSLLKDLDENFETRWIDSKFYKIAQSLESINPDGAKRISEHGKYIKNSLKSATLAYLALRHPKKAIFAVRKFEDEPSQRFAALVGPAFISSAVRRDVKNIISLANSVSSYSAPELIQMLVEKAIELRGGDLVAIKYVGSSGFRANCLKYVEKNLSESFLSYLIDALNDAEESNREVAIKCILRLKNKEDVEQILANYMKDQYYYNVICWADRYFSYSLTSKLYNL